jgi:hypothetical protein
VLPTVNDCVDCLSGVPEIGSPMPVETADTLLNQSTSYHDSSHHRPTDNQCRLQDRLPNMIDLANVAIEKSQNRSLKTRQDDIVRIETRRLEDLYRLRDQHFKRPLTLPEYKRRRPSATCDLTDSESEPNTYRDVRQSVTELFSNGNIVDKGGMHRDKHVTMPRIRHCVTAS